MKKLTKKSLDELAKVMPIISETAQRGYIGGSGDTGVYTYDEFMNMLDNGTWTGGQVEGMGYVLGEVTVTGSYPTGYYGASLLDRWMANAMVGSGYYDDSISGYVSSENQTGGSGGGTSTNQLHSNDCVFRCMAYFTRTSTYKYKEIFNNQFPNIDVDALGGIPYSVLESFIAQNFNYRVLDNEAKVYNAVNSSAEAKYMAYVNISAGRDHAVSIEIVKIENGRYAYYYYDPTTNKAGKVYGEDLLGGVYAIGAAK